MNTEIAPFVKQRSKIRAKGDDAGPYSRVVFCLKVFTMCEHSGDRVKLKRGSHEPDN